MATTIRSLAVASTFLSVARTANAKCRSYGMDYHNGGVYFQNSDSYDNFTFVSQFERCQPVFAYNLLYDPSGQEYLCSNVSMTPDDTDQQSTCPILKHDMYTGDWSVVIASDNGDDPSIAYQRDFYLNVGPQQTYTYTPTVTMTTTYTPVETQTSSTTSVTTETLPPSTTTVPSTTITRTKTVTPKPVTTTRTKTILTMRVTEWDLSIATKIVTKTAQCHLPIRQRLPDPTATITPVAITVVAAPTSTVLVDAIAQRSPELTRGQRVRDAVREEVQARRARRAAMAFHKRAPDSEIVTVTDTNTDEYQSTTSTITGPTSTVAITTTDTITSTVTPPPFVVVSGKTTAPRVTVTAATPTKTRVTYTVATTYTTKTWTATVKIRTTTTPSALAAACSSAGGVIRKVLG